MNDYDRIADIIRFLDTDFVDQPDFKQLAARLEISEYHFHRLFSRWAGVTPKVFVRCLTIEHAKSILRNGSPVLEASLDAGLSGPGRLHDLCVQLESASPGELQSGGRGWEIRYGFTESPFGTVLLADGPRGICHLSFVEDSDDYRSIGTLVSDWPEAELMRDDSHVTTIADLVFHKEPDQKRDRPLKAFVRGTPMQIKVWRALIQIPPGQLVSYGKLATAIGHPRAARAAGSAAGANPLAYLIPCHRVIRNTGVIGNYHWGTTRKRAIIARETAGLGEGSLRPPTAGSDAR